MKNKKPYTAMKKCNSSGLNIIIVIILAVEKSDLFNDLAGELIRNEAKYRHMVIKSEQLNKKGGRIVYIGLVKDTIQFVDFDLHAKEITLMASRNSTLIDFDFVINQIS